MNAINKLTIRMAEILADRLEIDARFPVNHDVGKKAQREHDDIAALLIAARMEPSSANEVRPTGALDGGLIVLRNFHLLPPYDLLVRQFGGEDKIPEGALFLRGDVLDIIRPRAAAAGSPIFEHQDAQFAGRLADAVRRTPPVGSLIDCVAEALAAKCLEMFGAAWAGDVRRVFAQAAIAAVRAHIGAVAVSLPSTPHAEAVRAAFPTSAAAYERAADLVRELAASR